MIQLPSLAAIRAFEAAARHQNFTRAGQELGLTQAAVSYQIAILEEHLGFALFVRAKGQVRLTPEAAKLAPAVTAALTSLSEAFAAVQSDDATRLVVSCTNTVATNWLAPRLGDFQCLAPDLNVELHISDALVTFDTADVAIRAAADIEPHLHAQLLMPIRVTPMASPSFLGRHPVCLPADIMSSPRLSPGDEWWQIWLDAAGVVSDGQGRNRLSLSSQVAEGVAAMSGHGLAILIPEFWSRELAEGRLSAPFGLCADSGHKLWIVCQKARRNLRKIKLFRDWLVSEFRASANAAG